MSKPAAVLISDIHFTPATLELASWALTAAQRKAKNLNVPLVICGDTLDTKAVVRAECSNALIKILNCDAAPKTYILVGNHDRLNEKGKEHALNFLKPYCTVVENHLAALTGIDLFSYFANLDELKDALSYVPKDYTIIMHQGVTSAAPGHYSHDKTAAPAEWFADYRVVSGHYHARQDIPCGPIRKGNVGLFSYVGNPYSTSFGEANDPEKGYQILMDDGSLEFVPLGLRKHVVANFSWNSITNRFSAHDGNIAKGDIVWVKVEGPRSELIKVKRESFVGPINNTNFKLDLIPTDTPEGPSKVEGFTDEQVLDAAIDATDGSDEHKATLKSLWRQMV